MSAISGIAGLYRPLPVCRIEGSRRVLFLAVFTAFAVAAPAICHACGMAGSVLLPMHFAVIFAAMVMGVRGGVATALLAPMISYGLSGMPPAPALVPMVLEMSTYAAVTGWLVHGRNMRPITALLFALAAGRIVWIGVLAFGFGNVQITSGYLRHILVLGLPGIALQLILLPPLAAKAVSFLKKG